MIKLSKRDNDNLELKALNDLRHIRAAAKKEPIIIDILNKYNLDDNLIDNVSVRFVKDLEVSAKTINGKIYLSAKMLNDNWKDYMHYFLHEFCHSAQHLSNQCAENSDVGEYLDNPAEIEAFKNQLSYRKKTEPKSHIDGYLKELFDRHNIPKRERPEKKKELLDDDK